MKAVEGVRKRKRGRSTESPKSQHVNTLPLRWINIRQQHLVSNLKCRPVCIRRHPDSLLRRRRGGHVKAYVVREVA